VGRGQDFSGVALKFAAHPLMLPGQTKGKIHALAMLSEDLLTAGSDDGIIYI